jgi:chromosome segregation and condensation protein ScpB
MNAKASTRRRSLLTQVHLGIKRRGLSNQGYRNWLEQVTGKRSCRDLTDAELELVAAAVRSSGALDGNLRGAADGFDRPTDGQWDKLAWLARELGWNGLTDARLATVVRRVAKVESPRFLTRQGITHVLIALEQSVERLHARRAAEAGSR